MTVSWNLWLFSFRSKNDIYSSPHFFTFKFVAGVGIFLFLLKPFANHKIQANEPWVVHYKKIFVLLCTLARPHAFINLILSTDKISLQV